LFLLFQKHIKVVSFGRGKYGRTIGIVYSGQRCLNEELVKKDFAWAYKKYCKTGRLLLKMDTDPAKFVILDLIILYFKFQDLL
jgi:endonuclease YncB( thermonuclease family)